MACNIEQIVDSARHKENLGCEVHNEINNREESYSLFVERYLEKPKYVGDPNLLTLPTASTFKGIPLLDDF